MEVRVIDDAHDLYRIALGDFMIVFAEIEEITYNLLVKVAGIDSVIAPAIFSGTRIQEAITLIRRIYDARGVTMEEVLQVHFQRLQEITRIRNQLAHYGVKFEYDAAGIAGAATLSNSRTAHIPSKLQEIEMGPETVYGLVRELEAIGMALWARLHPERFGL